MNLRHIDMQTKDGAQLNLDALYQIAPSCFTEAKGDDGEVHRVVDFNKLRLLLGDQTVEDAPEVYDFTWVGKRAALREAAAPINKTLRPCPEESVDWEHTQNLYIEGDNLEVLKLLQNSYMGKVKMIYIDPPYNTGNDFVYHDDFSQSAEEYDESNRDEEGNRYRKNTDSNGRFHSDWCSMVYARLMVARSLLTENGVIFVSIGDAELENLTKITDEIFGSSNRIGIVPRVMKSGGGKGQFFSPNIDYIVIYGRSISENDNFREPLSENIIKRLYTSIEKTGSRKGERYRPFGLYQSSLDPLRGCTNQRYFIEAPDGTLLLPPGNSIPPKKEDGGYIIPQSREDKVWRWTRDRYIQEKALGNIEFKESDGVLIDSEGKPAKWNVYTKIWLSERQEEGMTPVNFITKYENRHSAKELKQLGIPFDFAKPVGLLTYLASICSTQSEDIVLDFFSGSATTAHAVMQLNAGDGGKRKFIMVQLPEKTAEDSEAYKAGFKNICEIGKERIRRAGKQIKEENAQTTQDLDTGFRVFKCESSNYKDVAFAPKDYDQGMLAGLLDNIKEDRTDLDLLFDCMLRWGVELSMPMSSQKVDGCTIHNVNDGDLVACFDGHVTEAVIDAIATLSPVRVVFRDSSFNEAAQKMNLFELFKQKCDWTDEEVKNNVRVI